MHWLPTLFILCPLALVLACDDATEDGPTGPTGAAECASADLVAQCPAGSNPLLGVQAESACTGAASGLVTDGQGQATGQCYGAGSCRVVCQFAVPCRCGVESVTRAGVICADCEGAASCGNAICEGGETPDNCPIDCGAVCEPDERRCAGEVLEVCSLQGRWDTLVCPRDEVCSADDGLARCVRNIDIIGGGDMGVESDGGPARPMDGRVIEGDTPWPDVVPATRGMTPRAFAEEAFFIRRDDGSVHNRPTAFARASEAVAVEQFRLVPGARQLQGLGRNGHFLMNLDGTVLEPEGLLDEADFCAAAAENCDRDTADCDAFIAEQREAHAGRLYCLWQSVREGNCVDLFVGCQARYDRPYPGGATLNSNFIRQGDRILSVRGGDATVVDLSTGERWDMRPVGEYTISPQPGRIALSADGRVAAMVGEAGQDETFLIWNIESDERRPILPESGARGSKVALSPDGRVLSVARVPAGGFGQDELLHLYDLSTDTRIYSIRPPEGATAFGRAPAGVAFSPDARMFAVSYQPAQIVELWDLSRAERTHLLEFDAETRVRALDFSPDGALIAVTRSGGGEQPVNFWDVAQGQRLVTVPSPVPPVFEPDGARLLLGRGTARPRSEFVILSAP